MASSYSINSALGDVDFLVLHFSKLAWENDIFKKQGYRLRNLKTFVLCARKLGNDVHLRSEDNEDGSLGSLLMRIEDVVRRNARKIHFCCLKLKDPETDLIRSSDAYRAAKRIASGFETDIQSSKEEIDDWYNTLSNYTPQSSSLTADEVVELTESVLENLVDFPFTSFKEIEVKPTEALLEHMKFLKSFCRFVTKSGVKHGQMEDLLTHTEVVAIEAARLCFLCGDDNDDKEWQKRMQSTISTLLQKIKPIDRRVFETYRQALISCSQFSGQLHAPTPDMDDDSTSVMKNLINSLISILWDTLRLDTSHVDGQVLYEGLRSLRTIMKKLPDEIDERTWAEIGAVVCDAGVRVCSFYQKNADLNLEDLLERIKPFLEKKDSQTSIFNSSRINELGFVDYLLENLMNLTNDKAEPIVKSRVQTIQEELLYLRSIMGETMELRYEQVELHVLWNQVLEVSHRVEFLIDHLGDISYSFSMQFDSIMEDVRNIKIDSLRSFHGKRQDIKAKEVTRTSSHVPLRKIDSMTTEVVGFHEEALSIMRRLRGGSERLRVIAILGMAGLGKTTLAAKVYNDPLVRYHFHVCAWCSVSQIFDKKTVLLELLNQIHVEKYSQLTEAELSYKLWVYLKGRRYLIVLDDIWTVEAWNGLVKLFPDDSNGSRIILTSRNRDTVPLAMLDQEPHFLRFLTIDESFELLQRKLFPEKVWPPALYDLGMQIAQKCQGLPLTIVIVAGLLAATEQEGWKEIMNGLRLGIFTNTESCMNILELSYKQLPDYLKPCLLYFGAFPEGQEISVRRLIQLWIAEGFIRRSMSKSLEDVAGDYMMDLIGRSLIVVAQQRSTGGVKSCLIHSLLHDFCLKKAQDEAFFHLLKGYEELLDLNESCNLRRLCRLCIHSKPEHFKESKLVYPSVRSLTFFSQETGEYEKEASIDISSVIRIFKLVRVLDLEKIYLGDVLPSEIGLLVPLRYLSIRGKIRVIPSSIGNLSRLETFIVDPCGEMVSLPDTIWNLGELRYLYIRKVASHGGASFSIENLDNSSVLYELDRVSGIVFIGSRNMEKQMRKFPNIRKLKCRLFKHGNDVEEFQNIVVLDFLSRLESLDMSSYMRPAKNFEFSLPANLKKLTLAALWLPWSKISTIGRLPNLEVLKLLRGSFIGEIWEMEEEEFLNLRYLKLSGLDVVEWIASDDQFPCLQKLVLEGCRSLEVIPYCLGYVFTLQMIEISECSSATTFLVEQIQEEQTDLGNSDLKVIIHS